MTRNIRTSRSPGGSNGTRSPRIENAKSPRLVNFRDEKQSNLKPSNEGYIEMDPTDASISPDAKNERNASKPATPQGSISPAAVGSRSGGHRTCRISDADYQDVCRINNRGHKCTRHKLMACRLNSC